MHSTIKRTASAKPSSSASYKRSVQSADSANNFVIRPNYQKKFRPHLVKVVIKDVLTSVLADKEYESESAQLWTKQVCAELLNRLNTDQPLERYKYVAHVLIGQHKGAGIKSKTKCRWDSDTDGYAQEMFMSASLFCIATVYGVFYY